MTTLREAAEQLRDNAADEGDLSATLWFDDKLEDLGMHGDDRRTCHSCRSWADHSHDPITGRRIPGETAAADELEQQRTELADNLQTARSALVAASRNLAALATLTGNTSLVHVLSVNVDRAAHDVDVATAGVDEITK